jgi:hypothetical protein
MFAALRTGSRPGAAPGPKESDISGAMAFTPLCLCLARSSYETWIRSLFGVE